MHRRIVLVLLGLLMVVPSVQAQLRDAESAIKHRRAAFTLMSTYFGRITAMIKGDRPFDRAELIRNIELVQFVAKLPWEAFAPGSEIGNTRAEVDIWLEEDRFKAYEQDLHKELKKFLQVAQTGDMPALTQAFEATRHVCGSCHKVFRKDD
jgi:cytochrome c556